MKRFAAVLLIVFLALSSASLFAQETFTLKYGFTKGETYRFREEAAMDQTLEMMGQEMKTATRTLFITRIETEDVMKDGSRVFLVSLDTMSTAVKSSRMDTTIVMRELVGKRTRITADPLGNVLKREIVDTVGSLAEGMARQMGGRENYRLHRLSNKPLPVGGTWHSTIVDSFPSGGGGTVATSEIDYTIAGKEPKMGPNVLKISYSGTSTVKSKQTMMGSDVFTEGNGTTKGAFYFDLVRGLPLQDEGKNEMELTAALTGAQKMTIPMSQAGTATRTLIEK
jgi:hypothetical protein